ncbi:aldo/keto reductase [Kitasatospora azatica]|uniref:aldo/keto reductase n=1 Tax=Kitasatospora azatica TaxID=58347 RepID=UPI000AD39EF2|nr:aldo/keto reductase [Kitasatospora azatica]
MTLPKRQLGKTGFDITTVGFGAWAIGGGGWRYAWGDQDDRESIAAIRHAVELGINWVDTAAVYGLGHSEHVIGEALKGLSDADRPYVFTKAGLVWDQSQPDASPHRIMRPESVRREVEDSLRRLGVEAIDLYQVHYPDTGESLDWDAESKGAGPSKNATPLEEYWQTMADLKAEGKVRAIGLSNHDLDLLKRASAVAHIDTLQPPFSAINRGDAESVAWALEQGTGVIAYSPMQSGLLTGAFTKERVANLPANDWRTGNPDFTVNLDSNLALVDGLRPIAARRGVSVAELAIAWVLAWPGITGAIVGARRPEQIDGSIGGGSLELTEIDREEIAAVIERTGAGNGPIRP